MLKGLDCGVAVAGKRFKPVDAPVARWDISSAQLVDLMQGRLGSFFLEVVKDTSQVESPSNDHK